MKKILSYVAYQRKLNIKVDLKNRGTQLDIYDFMEIEVIPQSYTSYKNVGGNCNLCAICDYMNIVFNNGNAKYVPMPLTVLNNYAYNQVAGWYNYEAQKTLKDNQCYSLQDVINKGINCICSVACQGGYHAIAFVNGLFYNNWDNRKGLTIEELKQDFHYSRMPKLRMITTNDVILDKLNKCIKLGLIKEC